MDYKYSYQGFKEEKMARALGRGLPISVKHGVELGNTLRGMMVPKAKVLLENVIALKQPVRYGRFNSDLGHKKKIGPGRYPVKTSQYFLKVLKLAESNALFKGLSVNDLKIAHIVSQKAEARWRYGRQRRRKFKSSHVEIVLEEVIIKDKKEKPKTEPKKAEETAAKQPVEKPKEAKAPAQKQVIQKDEIKPKAQEKKADTTSAAKQPVEKKPEAKPIKPAPSTEVVMEKQAVIPKEAVEKKPEIKEVKKEVNQVKPESSQSPEQKKEEQKND